MQSALRWLTVPTAASLTVNALFVLWSGAAAAQTVYKSEHYRLRLVTLAKGLEHIRKAGGSENSHFRLVASASGQGERQSQR